MKIGIISFTKQGFALGKRIKNQLEKNHMVSVDWCAKENRIKHASLRDWSKVHFAQDDALVFVGAAGIAVRSIAPYVQDKLSDPAVLVIDEKGNFVIPILSGHVGGANALSEEIANNLSAMPVITTATDVNAKFAVDVFAKKNGLFIQNKNGIKAVSARLLREEGVLFSLEGAIHGGVPKELKQVPYPPTGKIDFLVSPYVETCETSLFLVPKAIVLGIGCKAGKSDREIEDFVETFLKITKIQKEAVKAVCSIDKKKEESGILSFCEKRGLPFFTYSAAELKEVSGTFRTSLFVEQTVGVDNVCERAALKGCKEGGTLIAKKCAKNGITLAAARMDWSVDFDE